MEREWGGRGGGRPGAPRQMDREFGGGCRCDCGSDRRTDGLAGGLGWPCREAGSILSTSRASRRSGGDSRFRRYDALGAPRGDFGTRLGIIKAASAQCPSYGRKGRKERVGGPAR